MKNKFSLVTILALALFLAASCSSFKNLGGGAPAPPQMSAPADSSQLEPGLSVLYIYGKWRHLNLMPSGEKAQKEGDPGKPIPQLNHQFGRGEVFASGTNRLVGLQLSGFINFNQPGQYAIQALSNDGLRVWVGQKLIVDDPKWHSDRLSPGVSYQVDQPGWQPLFIRYFQRKGTAALKFFWKTPGAADFVPVPPEALAHLPK